MTPREALHAVMEQEGLDVSFLRALLLGLGGRRVHVIGDAIRDVYTQATCLGTASKSPTLVLQTHGSESWDGGASVVAAHCRAAGAEVLLTTAGETIKERLIVEGVKVLERHTPAPHPLSDEGLREILLRLEALTDVVICADFRHGVFTPHTLPALLAALPDGVLRVADTQVSDSRWGNLLDFRGFDLLFANEREARFAMREADQPLPELGDRLYRRALCDGLVLKRGAQGLDVYGLRVTHLPAFAAEPIVDPIGAGDALLAYTTLAYHASKQLVAAAILGSLAAAEACAHQGNPPVTPEQIQARLDALE